MNLAEKENVANDKEEIPTFRKLSHLYHTISIDEILSLSSEAVAILVYIRALRQMGKTCFASNGFLAKEFGCTGRKIQTAINELIEQKKIKRRMDGHNRLLIEIPAIRELVQKWGEETFTGGEQIFMGGENPFMGGERSFVGGVNNPSRGGEQTFTHKINLYNTKEDKKEREEHPSGAVASLPRPSASDFDFSSAIAVPSGVQEQLTNPAFVSDDLDFIFPASWTGRGQQSLRLLIDTRTAQGKPGSKESYQGFVDSFANNELGFESFVNCQVRPRVISEMETTTEGAGLSKTETVGVAETNSVNLQAMVAEAVKAELQKSALSHLPATTGSETRGITPQGQEGAKMEPTEATSPAVSKPKAPKAARPPKLGIEDEIPEAERHIALSQLAEWLPTLQIKQDFRTEKLGKALQAFVIRRREKYLKRIKGFEEPLTRLGLQCQLTKAQKWGYEKCLESIWTAAGEGWKGFFEPRPTNQNGTYKTFKQLDEERAEESLKAWAERKQAEVKH